MSFPQFGPFESLFANPAPVGYLALLGLQPGQATQQVFDGVQRALDAGDAQRWVDAMLAERNWRPHLPAALAFILDRSLRLAPISLWNAIDVGSWVAPQLAVAELYSDRKFLCEVTARLDNYSAAAPLSGALPERWNQPKVAASLLAVAKYCPIAPEALDRWHRSPHITRLVAEDASWDKSGDIVARWKAALEHAFRERGTAMVAAFSGDVI